MSASGLIFIVCGGPTRTIRNIKEYNNDIFFDDDDDDDDV
jgi:hypothetical protein